jgi:hypothetical protein
MPRGLNTEYPMQVNKLEGSRELGWLSKAFPKGLTVGRNPCGPSINKIKISSTPYFCLLTSQLLSVYNKPFTDGELPNFTSPFGEIFFVAIV